MMCISLLYSQQYDHFAFPEWIWLIIGILNYNIEPHKCLLPPFTVNIDQCNASWIYLSSVSTEPVPNRGDFFFIGQTCQRRIIFMGPPSQYKNNVQIQIAFFISWIQNTNTTNTNTQIQIWTLWIQIHILPRKGDFFFIGRTCQQRIVFMGPLTQYKNNLEKNKKKQIYAFYE